MPPRQGPADRECRRRRSGMKSSIIRDRAVRVRSATEPAGAAPFAEAAAPGGEGVAVDGDIGEGWSEGEADGVAAGGAGDAGDGEASASRRAVLSLAGSPRPGRIGPGKSRTMLNNTAARIAITRTRIGFRRG